MNGILIIDKPQGMTSFDVVSFLRKKTGIKKIGHSGTLDPMATGVLPIFIGKATRIIEYSGIPDDPEAKIYRCGMKLGLETDTLDIWGTPLKNDSDKPEVKDKATIISVLNGFVGEGVQKPPMYSAVKIDGRKLYEYARKGIEVEEKKIKERMIYIKQIHVNHINDDLNEVNFDVVCSKGVYVRTLCSDAGQKLGCGAVLNELRRLKSDMFSIENAVSIDSIRDESIDNIKFLPIDTPLSWMPHFDLKEDLVRRFINGQKIEIAEIDGTDEIKNASLADLPVRVNNDDSFIGIGKIVGKTILKPEKILY